MKHNSGVAWAETEAGRHIFVYDSMVEFKVYGTHLDLGAALVELGRKVRQGDGNSSRALA